MTSQDYAARVLAILSSNPTAADLDFLVASFANLSYLSADAERIAEEAETARKVAEAEAYLNAKRSADKVTDKVAESEALLACRQYRDAEVKARVKARKLAALVESVEQAINAIKFLGRYDSPSVTLPKAS